MRNGRYLSALKRSSPDASTTVRTFFSRIRSKISMYKSSGSPAGMLPARIKISPSEIFSIFEKSASTALAGIFGPRALISVSVSDLSLTFMRDVPPGMSINSSEQPRSAKSLFISAPVNPAQKPSAKLSNPKFLRTTDTFIPFPPGYIFSSYVRFILPAEKFLVQTV